MQINPNVAIIEALPGVGGDESKLWMKELLLSYLRFAQRKLFKFSYLHHRRLAPDNSVEHKNESCRPDLAVL